MHLRGPTLGSLLSPVLSLLYEAELQSLGFNSFGYPDELAFLYTEETYSIQEEQSNRLRQRRSNLLIHLVYTGSRQKHSTLNLG